MGLLVKISQWTGGRGLLREAERKYTDVTHTGEGKESAEAAALSQEEGGTYKTLPLEILRSSPRLLEQKQK